MGASEPKYASGNACNEITECMTGMMNEKREQIEWAKAFLEIKGCLNSVEREVKHKGPRLKVKLTIEGKPDLTKEYNLNIIEVAKLDHEMEWRSRRP
jgi:hypothetical protein